MDPSLFSSRSLLLDEEELEEDEDEVVGTPVDVSSREMPRVNAASRSSRRRMHLCAYGEGRGGQQSRMRPHAPRKQWSCVPKRRLGHSACNWGREEDGSI